MKILHVDDQPMFREGLRFFFKLLDADVLVLEASNIQGALDKLALESPVDLLVLDLQMPGMSELEGFFAIHRRYPALPIVIVSGVNDPRVIRALIDGGARGYSKFAGSEQLMDALAHSAWRDLPAGRVGHNGRAIGGH
jgi:DNA-binding NarL/FixJ family response regulator